MVLILYLHYRKLIASIIKFNSAALLLFLLIKKTNYKFNKKIKLKYVAINYNYFKNNKDLWNI